MAIVKEMPSEAIISGFRGKIDYYYYCGLCVVRKWPSSPGRSRTPPVKASWAAFAYASREWNNLTPAARSGYIEFAGTSGLTGRDLFQRAYMKGLYRNPIP